MPEYLQGASQEIFPDGSEVNFTVVDAGEKEAASGNTMIELQLDCSLDNQPDKVVRVVDRLVFVPNSYWKIDSFRRATGEQITENQKITVEPEDLIDRRGRCALKISDYQGRSRNDVDFYVEPSKDQPQSPPAAKAKVDQPF